MDVLPYFPSPMKADFPSHTCHTCCECEDSIDNNMMKFSFSNCDNEIEIGDTFDWSSYLFPPNRDFLIRNNGDKVFAHDLAGKYIVIVGFYIPIPKQHVMAELCKDVITTYHELKSKGINDFEFVLVTHMNPDFPEYTQASVVETCFDHFFSAFSCPAIPIFDTTCSRKLLQAMGIYGPYHYTCLIFSPEGQVLQNDLLIFNDYGAESYPFSKEQLIERMRVMADIPKGLVSLRDLLCTTTCDVLSVPDCVISPEPMSLYKIRKRYVWLYLFYDAYFFAQFLSLWASYHEEVEVILIYPIHADMEYREFIRKTCREEIIKFNTFRSQYDKKFRMLECRMSRLLWLYSGHRTFDQLIVSGFGFVELHGREIYMDYSHEAFPFCKKLLYNNIVNKLRCITIGKIASMLPPGLDVDGREVFLYMGYSEKYDLWEHQLAEWCSLMKRSRPNFQLVFLCLEDKEVASPDNSWIMIPYEHSCKIYNTFKSLKFANNPTIYAYGADGIIVSINAQQYILDLDDSTPPDTFPDFSYLEDEVATHLMDMDDYWSELFREYPTY